MMKKAVLLSGPPGIGKTSSALIVCRELGFEPIEVRGCAGVRVCGCASAYCACYQGGLGVHHTCRLQAGFERIDVHEGGLAHTLPRAALSLLCPIPIPNLKASIAGFNSDVPTLACPQHPATAQPALQVNASDAHGKSDASVLKGVGGKLANAVKELTTNRAVSYDKNGKRKKVGGRGFSMCV